MNIQLTDLQIPVEEEVLQGSMLHPPTALPGILFVHGWGGSREQDLNRAREASGLGCVCLTVDLRGHDLSGGRSRSISRAENLQDLICAYDWLVRQPTVDPNAIAVVGISYGGYLSTILATLRPVKWLALRSPALYKDDGWELPKRELNADQDLHRYRRTRLDPADNGALRAAAAFHGDALIVASEHDDIVPHTVFENYVAAFSRRARSVTTRILADADHALTELAWRRAYTAQLIRWLTEMVVGARESAAATRLDASGIQNETA